jgi:hypothetical protein
MNNLGDFARSYVRMLDNASLRLARRIAGSETPPLRLIISHPAIYSNVHLIGRPGIRFPVPVVGLHYQILEDSTQLVFAPGIGFSPAVFVEALRRGCKRMISILQNASASQFVQAAATPTHVS